MTRNALSQIVAATGLLVAFSMPTSASAQHRCDAPVTAIDQRACAQAAEGPDALRHFVNRTRMILGLDIYDYLREKEPVTVAAKSDEPAKPSRAEEPAVRPTTTASRAP